MFCWTIVKEQPTFQEAQLRGLIIVEGRFGPGAPHLDFEMWVRISLLIRHERMLLLLHRLVSRLGHHKRATASFNPARNLDPLVPPHLSTMEPTGLS